MITIKTDTAFKVLVAYKTDGHAGATGLTPTLTVTQVSDGTDIVDAQTMTELKNGGYYYEIPHADIDADDAYYVYADGGATLTTYRYQMGAFYGNAGNEDTIATIDGKVDTIDTNVDTVITNIATVDNNVDDIKDTVDTNLDTQVSLAGEGAGDIQVTFPLIINGAIKSGERIWVTDDINGTILKSSKSTVTNSSGTVSWQLALGTYYVWIGSSTTYVGTLTITSSTSKTFEQNPNFTG